MGATPVTDFGTDTSCLTGLRTGRLASGVQLVAEAIYRRLSTPRGMLRGGDDEANYGIDLADMIGQVSTPSQVAALPGQIQSEVKKDERVQEVTVTATAATGSAGDVTWAISIECTTALGPFSLVLSVNAVTVELLNLQIEAT